MKNVQRQPRELIKNMNAFQVAEQLQDTAQKCKITDISRNLTFRTYIISIVQFSPENKASWIIWRLGQQLWYCLVNFDAICLYLCILVRIVPRTQALQPGRFEKGAFRFAPSATKLSRQQLSHFRAHISVTNHIVNVCRFLCIRCKTVDPNNMFHLQLNYPFHLLNLIVKRGTVLSPGW